MVGAATLAVALTGYLQAPIWQATHAEEVVEASPSVVPVEHFSSGSSLARLKIPKIRLDVAVIEGTRRQRQERRARQATGWWLRGGL